MSHLSEEDIRTKIVYEWLKDCGFTSEDLLLEHTFKVKLGKQTKFFRPRADILIKNKEGENLLVIEVKAPKHKLNTEDIEQAVSYARLLKDGIAPFTILTNGKDSRIFDSVTKEEINSTSIPSTHTYVINGFKPTSDGLNAKLEAAEYLITISSDNLKSFCKIQVEDKISILKGDDIYSGKKYIPSLYVERKESQEQLRSKLFEKKNQLLLVIGNPQQGKTCFMCHSVEQFLLNDYLSLFYPAINLNKGLLLAIKEDFEWCFGIELSISQVLKKVNSICLKQGKQMFIFIDGWDEMAKGALEINEECKRLNLSNISIILSLTLPSLGRLLVDSVDNSTYVGEEVGLDQPTINSLSKKLLKNTTDKHIIQIENFNNEESLLAREIYKQKFEIVSMPEDKIFNDPFYLRITCETYAGKHIPINLTRTDLIKSYLYKKAARRNIGEFKLLNGLSQLAEVFYEYGRPVNILNCIHIFKEDTSVTSWKESGILIQTRNEENSTIDFYNTNILNYSIAHCYKKWEIIFKTGETKEISNNLNEACAKDVTRNALLWFLSCPENNYLIKDVFETLDINSKNDLPLNSLLAEAIIRQIKLNDKSDFKWLEKSLPESYTFDSDDVNLAPALAYAILKSIDVKNDYDTYKYWIKILIKHDSSYKDIGFENSYIAMLYGEIRSMDGTEDSDIDYNLFYNLIFDNDYEIAQKAALYYSYSNIITYLEKFTIIKRELLLQGKKPSEILILANEHIEYDLSDMYYGNGMCKGWLLQFNYDIGSYEVKDEFHKMNRLLTNIIDTHPNTELSESLLNMLEDLKRIGEIDEEDIEIKYDNPNQLTLDL